MKRTIPLTAKNEVTRMEWYWIPPDDTSPVTPAERKQFLQDLFSIFLPPPYETSLFPRRHHGSASQHKRRSRVCVCDDGMGVLHGVDGSELGECCGEK
ncbi:MAG: hypothetical protein WCJ84_00555 [Candidatus Peregrinibacteria bacterium]